MQSHLPTWQQTGGPAWQLPPFRWAPSSQTPVLLTPDLLHSASSPAPTLQAFGFVTPCSVSTALTPAQSVSFVRSAHPARGRPSTEHRDSGCG